MRIGANLRLTLVTEKISFNFSKSNSRNYKIRNSELVLVDDFFQYTFKILQYKVLLFNTYLVKFLKRGIWTMT